MFPNMYFLIVYTGIISREGRVCVCVCVCVQNKHKQRRETGKEKGAATHERMNACGIPSSSTPHCLRGALGAVGAAPAAGTCISMVVPGPAPGGHATAMI